MVGELYRVEEMMTLIGIFYLTDTNKSKLNVYLIKFFVINVLEIYGSK